MIQATVSNIESVLNDSAGGFTVELFGTIPKLTLNQVYAKPITILSHRAKVLGLLLSGGNVNWIGGTVEASQGSNGVAAGGYGIQYGGSAKNYLFSCVNIRNADRGVVGGGGENIRFLGCDLSVRQDGFILAGGNEVQIVGCRFHDFYPKPSICTLPDGTKKEWISSKDCTALGGTWKDGDHSDAIQLRNGCKNFLLAYNKIESISQGIGQMDSVGDAPLDDIQIIGNEVEVTGFHSITIGPNSTNISVIGNRTKQMTGRRSPLRLPVGAIVIDNLVQSP